MDQHMAIKPMQQIQLDYLSPSDALNKLVGFLPDTQPADAMHAMYNMSGAAQWVPSLNLNHADIVIIGFALLMNVFLVLKSRASH